MQATIVLLPGDGIGPEIVSQAARVLQAVAKRYGHQFSLPEHLIGGIAIDQTGDPLPADTVAACKASAAVLLGQWVVQSGMTKRKTRPEAGLLRIRKEMQLFANLRPIQTFAELVDASPLKREIVEGTDILFFRELTGGIYFGPSGRETVNGVEQAFATELYSVPKWNASYAWLLKRLGDEGNMSPVSIKPMCSNPAAYGAKWPRA